MRAACGGVFCLWIQSVFGVGKCGAEVTWLKMTVVYVCVRKSQSRRKTKVVRIVVRRYKEGVCISHIAVRPNINTEMAK